MRRISYFIATNAAIMAVFSIIILLLPPEYRAQHGLFLMIATMFGFSGAIVSLLMSKSIGKRGLQMVTEPRNETEQWLLRTVERQAKEAGIGMPEVGIIPMDEMNAFATGASRNNALVAVSTGLLENMTREEAEAVMAHEIAHVANGDMITMALIQGVLNVFVFIMARALAMVIDRGGRGGFGYYIGFFIGQTVFGFLASLVVFYFSRRREFRADNGGAKYASRQGMIAALERLKMGKSGELPNQLAAFGINTDVKKMFSTHPPLDDRIAALRNQ